MKNILLLIVISLQFLGCKTLADDSTISPQEVNIPEPGEYYSLIVDGGASLNFNYNLAAKSWVWDYSPNIKFLPNPLGKLRFTANGTYEFIDLKKTGTYRLDKSTNKILFTGDLKNSEGYYKVVKRTCILLIVSKLSDGTKAVNQYEKYSDFPQPEIANPNNGFTETIVASLGFGTVDYVDLVSTKTVNTFSYLGNTKVTKYGKSLNMEDARQNFKLIFYPEIEIKDFSGKKIVGFLGKSNSGKKWETGGYDYGVLSPDESKFILSGGHIEKAGTADYNYEEINGPSYSIIEVSTGNELKVYQSDFQNKWKASLLPNGGIILPHKGGGIDVTDASFSKITTIYANTVLFAKCSPDGKTILFQKGSQLFTINADGKGEKQFTNTDVNLDFSNIIISDVCWSPDSKAVAIMMKDETFSNKYTAILLSADGKKASMVQNKLGETTTFVRPYISWISLK